MEHLLEWLVEGYASSLPWPMVPIRHWGSVCLTLSHCLVTWVNFIWDQSINFESLHDIFIYLKKAIENLGYYVAGNKYPN